jgi:hypothetical protein
VSGETCLSSTVSQPRPRRASQANVDAIFFECQRDRHGVSTRSSSSRRDRHRVSTRSSSSVDAVFIECRRGLHQSRRHLLRVSTRSSSKSTRSSSSVDAVVIECVIFIIVESIFFECQRDRHRVLPRSSLTGNRRARSTTTPLRYTSSFSNSSNRKSSNSDNDAFSAFNKTQYDKPSSSMVTLHLQILQPADGRHRRTDRCHGCVIGSTQRRSSTSTILE